MSKLATISKNGLGLPEDIERQIEGFINKPTKTCVLMQEVLDEIRDQIEETWNVYGPPYDHHHDMWYPTKEAFLKEYERAYVPWYRRKYLREACFRVRRLSFPGLRVVRGSIDRYI